MIELRNLSIDLGEFHLHDISLAINDGEYMVLLGPTGAGKTVLVECVVGIHRPRAGAVVVDGHDVADLYPEERNVGYVPQDYALFPNMTVRENLAYGLEARDVAPEEREEQVAQMMDDLAIAHLHYRYPLNLSGGERQRVALGRALITKPRVLLLDEPLSALDENLRTELAAELRSIQRSVSGTFLHVCHSFEEAAEVADRVAIMKSGRIAQVGTIDDVVARPASLFVARFSRTRNIFSGTARPLRDGSSVLLPGGHEIVSTCDRLEGAVTACVRPEDIEMVNGGEKPPRDLWCGRVTQVRRKLTHTELFVRGPVELVVHDRNQNARRQVGDQLWLRIPPAAVKLFPESET